MTPSQSTLWTEETKRTGTGTLFTDADGFVGVELKFGFHARHPENEKMLLRDWVSDIPGAEWKKAAGAWIVSDIRDIPRGWLKRAGFVVQHANGLPARPSDLAETPIPPLERAATLKSVPEWFGVELFDDQTEGAELMVSGRNFLADEPGGGKGSPVWTKILTPNGWTTYGEIAVGDFVIGSNGKSTCVTGVYPRGELEVFRVTMSDGSSVVVDGDHLWEVQTNTARKMNMHSTVLSTREIMERGISETQSNGCWKAVHFIPMVEPVHFSAQPDPLPLDPYLLGLILGDGGVSARATVTITTMDDEIVESVKSLLPPGHSLRATGTKSKATSYSIRGEGRGIAGGNLVVNAIRDLGLDGKRSWEKSIPKQYLMASPEDRLAVLQGLLDTDGWAGVKTEFVSVSEQLIDDVTFIVQSLGGVARKSAKSTRYTNRHGQKVAGRPAFRLIIGMPRGLCPFRLSRKVTTWSPRWKYPVTRSIASIEPAGRDEVVCISVDAENQLYVTEDFIVTHNTYTALATAALLQSKRTLVLCQPVALTHWYRSSERSGLPAHVGGTTVMIRTGRKQPPLPETGVVIVSAALVTNRPELARELAEWQPMAFFLDESQQVMTWSSRRSRVLRRLSRSCTIGIPMTGTPAPGATPMDFAAQLDIAGMLEPTFGSFLELRTRYMKPTKFGWKVNKDRVKEFNSILETLWVRRIKNKRPVFRSTMEADYDAAVYDEALSEVNAKIDEWFEEFSSDYRRSPDEDEIKEWCSGRGDLTSRLREAAGLAKVPFALELIKEYVKANPKKDGKYPRPLIVWAHHHSVTAALMEGIQAFDPMLIDGTSSHTQRSLAEDEYQAGHLGVLVCSIKAAGTSITLTRGNESIFVELDWTPDNIIQAERRQNRIGQEADHVIYTTLVAPGTLDERVADVLFGKSGVLEAMTGGDYAVIQKAPRKASGPVFASTILREMVEARLALAA